MGASTWAPESLIRAALSLLSNASPRKFSFFCDRDTVRRSDDFSGLPCLLLLAISAPKECLFRDPRRSLCAFNNDCSAVDFCGDEPILPTVAP